MSPPLVAVPGITAPAPRAAVPMQLDIIRLFFPALFSLGGLFLVYLGGRKVLRAKLAVRKFESVPAQVVSARLDDGPDRTSRTYAPEVTYTYTYEGEEYTSSTVHPGGTWMTGNQERMQSIVDEYDAQIGQEVTAHVDPEDPGNAYLREGRLRHAYVTIVFGAVLLAVAAWVGSVAVSI